MRRTQPRIEFATRTHTVPTSPWTDTTITSLSATSKRGRSIEFAECGAFLTEAQAREAAKQILKRFGMMTDRRSLMPAIRPRWREDE